MHVALKIATVLALCSTVCFALWMFVTPIANITVDFRSTVETRVVVAPSNIPLDVVSMGFPQFPHKLIDITLINTEIEMLQFRMAHHHSTIVSHTIVFEANQTLAGDPKPLYAQQYNQRTQYFQPYIDAGRLIIATLPPLPICEFKETIGPKFAWEVCFRVATLSVLMEMIDSGVWNLTDDDFIYQSDIDEILRPSAIVPLLSGATPEGTVKLCISGPLWYYSVYCEASPLWVKRRILMQTVGFVKEQSANNGWLWAANIDNCPKNEPILKDAIWHFSYFFTNISMFRNKLSSFTHAVELRMHKILEYSDSHLSSQILDCYNFYNHKTMSRPPSNLIDEVERLPFYHLLPQHSYQSQNSHKSFKFN